MRTNLSREKEGDGKKGLHSVAARSEIAWHLLLHVNIWETIIESCGPRWCDVPSLFLASVTGYACLVRREKVLEMLRDPNEEPPVKDDNERWGAASQWDQIHCWIKHETVRCVAVPVIWWFFFSPSIILNVTRLTSEKAHRTSHLCKMTDIIFQTSGYFC